MANEGERKAPVIHWRGERLKALREDRTLNRNQLATALGFDQSDQVRRWEKNETSPQAHHFMRLVIFFGVTPAYFFALERDADARGRVVDFVRDVLGNEEAEVLRYMRDLDAQDKGRLVERAAALLEMGRGGSEQPTAMAASRIGKTSARAAAKIEEVRQSFPAERIERLAKIKKKPKG